ncbi:MAG: UDP-3-O-(3-hydroxymyristoyl)glucosamine N-acyltransferase [Gammaproteobacteria bacterium]|nr:UDP-3-O-(3-hydroxymyristoyl)glucosamine N-acyltransferase [Gammaproteobacteria bacterium]
MTHTLADLAARFEVEVRGAGDTVIETVATLHNSGPGAISFLANPKYRKHLATTRASAVVLSAEDAGSCPVPMLITDNPYAVYAKIAGLLHPQPVFSGGVHAAAVVDPTAQVAADAWIGPGSVLEAGAVVGEAVFIGPNCVVGKGVHIGDGSRLVAGVILNQGVHIGKRALLHPGVVIGSDGFGLAKDGDRWIKVPQLGGVRIGDDVEIGANTTVDRGALEDTVIENGVKLDNQIQVAHNVRIGEHTAIAGCAGIAGSATIGKRCMIAGAAGIAGHIDIADDVMVTAMTLVSHTISTPGVYSGSLPMDSARQWRKNSVRFKHLDELARRIKALEEKSKKD